MSARQLDRGMLAVRRARSVRERDSRIGMSTAVAQREQQRARVTDLRTQLDDASTWREGDTPSFLAGRAGILALGDALASATERLEQAARVADAAHAHWSSDKARLSAVESLLERRAEQRRAERERRVAAELDDVAAQLWIRARAAATTPDRSPASPRPEAPR